MTAQSAPQTETLEGTFDVTKQNGVELKIEFCFEYPKGEGMTLWRVLKDFAIPDQTILDHLLATGDASLAARALEMGYDEDEED